MNSNAGGDGRAVEALGDQAGALVVDGQGAVEALLNLNSSASQAAAGLGWDVEAVALEADGVVTGHHPPVLETEVLSQHAVAGPWHPDGGGVKGRDGEALVVAGKHVDEDVLASYLNQLAMKLKQNGVGFFHHSNLGSYRMAVRMTIAAARHVIPQRFVNRFVERGILVNLGAWRAENVTAKRFVELCDAAGLACIGQEMVSWEHGSYKIDTLSMFTRRGWPP